MKKIIRILSTSIISFFLLFIAISNGVALSPVDSEFPIEPDIEPESPQDPNLTPENQTDPPSPQWFYYKCQWIYGIPLTWFMHQMGPGTGQKPPAEEPGEEDPVPPDITPPEDPPEQGIILPPGEQPGPPKPPTPPDQEDNISIDLDIDSNNDGSITEEDDPIEEEAPGKNVTLNNDDDNHNTTQDRYEDGIVDNENDLVEMELSVQRNGTAEQEPFEWKLSYDSLKAIVYDADSNEMISDNVWYSSDEYFPPSELFLEGIIVSNDPGDVTIEAFIRTEECQSSDRVCATVVSKKWTIMIYLDGDNDLEPWHLIDFNEISSIGSNDNVCYVVIFDRIPGVAVEYGWSDTRQGVIYQSDVPDLSWGERIGEKNMGDPNTLIDFTHWAISEYPAENYGLILENHGMGWSGACTDFTSNNDFLSTKEIENALASIDTHIDLLRFDACLMANIEVAYEVRNEASVYVASETINNPFSCPYDTIFTNLNNNPDMSPTELAFEFVDNTGLCQSAVNLNTLNILSSSVSNLATIIKNSANESDYRILQNARNLSKYIILGGDPDYAPFPYDLGKLLYAITISPDLNITIKVAAETTYQIFDQTVIASKHWSTGLSIYFQEPGNAPNPDYNSQHLAFANDTQWDEFLQWWETGPDGL